MTFAEEEMLTSRAIPQFEDRPEDWQRFLYKATTGSAKATDMLSSAELAYMVDLTGDPESPNELPLDEYAILFRSKFPESPPFRDEQQIVDYGAGRQWFEHRFEATNEFRNDRSHYSGIWERHQVDWTALANDAILTCRKNWTSEFALECIDQEGSLAYDSREAVAGMLFLSLTWPKNHSSEQDAGGKGG